MRKIIHLDADSFYASIEILHCPELKEHPIAVGGQGRRGVISTCNYIARAFGVRSAMAMGYAKKLCPDLKVLPPRFDEYKRMSQKIFDIYREYTEKMEPLSLDEAFLDVTESTQCGGSATLIAHEIRQRVKQQTGLTVSAGVAPLKFLAKVASDWNKPDGLFVVKPEDVPAFIPQLKIKLLPGIGPVTSRKLAAHGIHSVKDLDVYGEQWLLEKFGKLGAHLLNMRHGIDEREIQPLRERKSLSVESTFSQDIEDKDALLERMVALIEELRSRCRKLSEDKIPYKRFVKVKFHDFTKTSVETVIESEFTWSLDALEAPENDYFAISAFTELLYQALARQDKAVRLLGVGFRLIGKSEEWEQLGLGIE